MKFPPSNVTMNFYFGGGGGEGKKSSRRRVVRKTAATLHMVPYSITVPGPGSAVQVTQIGGVNHIAATGGSLASNGDYPSRVWAQCYPNITADPINDPNLYEPNSSTAVSVPTGSNGSWSFTAGNLIPGAMVGSGSSGPSNSTLVIWYQYDYEFQNFLGFWEDETEYTLESVRFRGVLGGSGMVAPLIVPSHLPAARLNATFHGSLSRLGSVPLTWNGVGWAGNSGQHGGFVLSLSYRDGVYQMTASGPATSFVVAESPTSPCPFQLHAEGHAYGTVCGSFKVTITE